MLTKMEDRRQVTQMSRKPAVSQKALRRHSAARQHIHELSCQKTQRQTEKNCIVKQTICEAACSCCCQKMIPQLDFKVVHDRQTREEHVCRQQVDIQVVLVTANNANNSNNANNADNANNSKNVNIANNSNNANNVNKASSGVEL